MHAAPTDFHSIGDVEEDPLRSSISWLWSTLLGARPEWRQNRLSISNKELSFNWLDELQLPLVVSSSHVGRLHVTLPSAVRAVDRYADAAAGTAGGSQCDRDDSCWFEVQVADVFAILGPAHPHDVEVDSQAILDTARRAKRQRLQAVTKSLILPEQRAKKAAPSGLHTFLASLRHEAIGKLLRHASIDVQNVHLRYEDPITSPRFVFSGGLLLKHLVLSNAPVPSAQDDGTHDAGTEVLRKRAVACLSMYWQSYNPEMFSNKPDWKSSMARQQDTHVESDHPPPPPVHQVLSATDIKANFCSPCSKTGAAMSVEITLPKFVPCFTHAMVGDLVLLAQLYSQWSWWLQNELSACARFRQLAPQQRPTANPKAWWRHAVTCMQTMRRAKEVRRYWWSSDVMWQLRMHRAYLDLVEQEMLEREAAADKGGEVDLQPELDHALDNIEGALPQSLLELWREQAAGHSSLPEDDLRLLGVRRRAVGSEASKTGWRGLEMDVSVASERGTAGETSSSPPSAEFAVSVEAQRLGISFREAPVLHPLHRVPFEIVSHRAYTSNYKSQDCPANHQVLGKPMGGIGKSNGRFPWNAHLAIPKTWSMPCTESAWTGLSTGSPAKCGGRGPQKLLPAAKEMEVTLQEVRIQAQNILSAVSPLTASLSVQKVRVSRPRDGKVAAQKLPEVRTPLLTSYSMSEQLYALQANLHAGPQDGPGRLKIELGHFKVSATPENVEDVVFLLQELLPRRSGKEAYYLMFSRCIPLLPQERWASVPYALLHRESSFFSTLEVSLFFGNMLLCGVGGCNRRAALTAELRQGHLSCKRKPEMEAESTLADGALLDAHLSGHPSPSPWSLRTKFTFVLSGSARKSTTFDTEFLGEGTGADENTCVDGKVLSKLSECTMEAAVSWYAAEAITAPKDNELTSEVEVNILQWKMHLEETYTILTVSEVLGSLVEKLPQRLPRCVLSSRMKLWYPPRLTSMHQRSSMTKEGPGSESDDDDRYDESRGHWSCDIWGELLENGSMELYSHPSEVLPLYVLQVQEMRGGTCKQATQVRRAPLRATKDARELEVLVTVPEAAVASEASTSNATNARKNNTGVVSAWVYIQCLDSLSSHWVSAWEARIRSIQKGAGFCLAQGRGGRFGVSLSRRKALVCPSPWIFRLNLLHARASVQTCFNAPVHLQCEGLSVEFCARSWQLSCSLDDARVEDEGYAEADKRRSLIAVMPDALGSSLTGERCTELSASLARGGHLRMAAWRVSVNPVQFRRLMHAICMLREFLTIISACPLLESGLSHCASVAVEAVPCMNAGRLRLSSKLVKEEHFVFNVAPIRLEVNCLQSFTSCPIAVMRLEGLGMQITCQSQHDFAVESVSVSLGGLLLQGVSGNTIVDTSAQMHNLDASGGSSAIDQSPDLEESPGTLETQGVATGASDDEGQACKSTAPPFVQALASHRLDARVWSLRASTASAWRISYYHADCCRIGEFARDILNACTWAYPMASTASTEFGGRLWPFAWLSAHQSHCCSTWCNGCNVSCPVLCVEANIDLHLPSIFVPSIRVHAESLPELAAGTWIEVALGRLVISSSLAECSFPSKHQEEVASKLETTCSIVVKWSGFLCITAQTHSLLNGNSPIGEQASSLEPSQGCHMVLNVNVELQPLAENARRCISVKFEASEVLSLTMPCSVLQVFFCNACLHETVCKAPAIPAHNAHVSVQSSLWGLVLEAISTSCFQLTAHVEIAGCLLEITDVADQACLRGRLLGVHQDFCYHADCGLFEEFGFHLETLSLESHQGKDWRSLFFVQRSQSQVFDAQATLSKTVREFEASGRNGDDEAKTLIDSREVRVIVGAPRLHVDPILLSYCQYMACCAEGVTAELPSSTHEAKFLQSMALAQRRAEAMAAAYHQNLEDFLPYLPQAHGFEPAGTRRTGLIHRPHLFEAAAAAGTGIQTVVEFECGGVFVELPCPSSSSLIHLSMRPAATFRMQSGFGELDTSVKLEFSECRVSLSDAKGTRGIIRPFKMLVNLQYERRHQLVDKPSWQAPYKEAARATADLEDITINVAWQDVLALLEWQSFLEPPREAFDASFKECNSLKNRWRPVLDPRSLTNLAATVALPASKNLERRVDIGNVLAWMRTCFGTFTETAMSFGGLTCVLQDRQGLACKLCVQPMHLQAGLFQATGSSPAEADQPKNLTCRAQLTFEFELWHSWTKTWEPVLEPCNLVMICSVSPGHEILTLNCPSVRTCLRVQHIQEGRWRCSRAQAELKLAEEQWNLRRQAIWQCSPTNIRTGRLLAFESLQWGPPAVLDEHEDDVPQENQAQQPGDPQLSASGQQKSATEGSLLRVRNDTGCSIALTLDLQKTVRLEDGNELAIGHVGKIQNTTLCLHSDDPTVSDARISDIQMLCSAPVTRAFPTGWSDTLLWQEVLDDTNSVCCRFHSPICVVNQTPLAVEVRYDHDVTPSRILPGDTKGLCLSHIHNFKDLRLRICSPGSSDWSRPITLETTYGTGYVLKCGTSCELVIEITSSGKPPGTKIHASCEQTTLVLSPRCTVYNSLPIPLQVRLGSSRWPDAAPVPSPPLTIAPEHSVATMSVFVGGDELWIAVAQAGQSSWSQVQPVQLRSVQQTSATLTLESQGRDAHEVSILQVEVRSVFNIHGRYLGPRVALGIYVSHMWVSHCPFSLSISARIDEEFCWMTPLTVPSDEQELQLWALPMASLRLHGDPATGPIVSISNEDIPETGALAARIGDRDVAVSRCQAMVSASVGISSLFFVIVPRFWIFNHLEFDVEARQVDRDVGLVDIAASVTVKPESGAVFHLPRQANAPTLTFRRCRVVPKLAWSGPIDICHEQRCTLTLHEEDATPLGIVLVEVVQQPTGQIAIHLSLAEVPEFHIENHTCMQLRLQQVGYESLKSTLIQPFSVMLWSWPDPAAARRMTRGSLAPLQIQCSRWRASEWLSVRPQELENCSARHSGTELTARIRNEEGVCVIAITANARVQEDQRISAVPLYGQVQRPRHLRVSFSDVSISIVGKDAEIFRLTLTGLVGGEDFLISSQTVLLSLAAAKLDHLAPGAAMPAVIRTAPPKRGLFFTAGCSWNWGLRSPSGVAPAPLLEAHFLDQRRDCFLDCLDVHITELWVSAHVRSLATSLLGLMEAMTPCKTNTGLRAMQLPSSEHVPLQSSMHIAMMTSAFAPPWHPPQHTQIRELRLSPVILQLQVSMLNFDIGSFDRLGRQWEAARRTFSLLSGRDLHENRICLREFIAYDVTGSVRSVWELLKTHYGYAMCHQALSAMCASDSAYPSSGSDGRRLMRQVSNNLEYLFQTPLSPLAPSQSRKGAAEEQEAASIALGGAQKPVLQVMGSMGRGSVSFLSYNAQGARHSVAHVTRFFGRSIVLVSLDAEFESEVTNSPFQHSSKLVHGFDLRGRPLNTLISQVGCWISPSIAHQDNVLSCSNPPQVCGEDLQDRAHHSASALSGTTSSVETPRGAHWQMFMDLVKPVAGFLGLDSSLSDFTTEASRHGAEDELVEGLPDFSLPPPPRLLLGPHRLIMRYHQRDAQLRRLLDQLADEVGRGICYEDHCAALEPNVVNLLTDAELLVIRSGGSVRVERRWALDGVAPMSVRADGSLVHFSAELGVSGTLEISIGSGELRCINAATADRFANSIRHVAVEAQFRRVPSMLGAQHISQSDKTVVSL